MKKLDYYIIKKFTSTFCFTVFVFTAFAVLMDVSERIHRFIENDLTLNTVLVEYYFHFIPWINGLLWPLFTLISVIFFVSRMAREAEIISILNAGVSFFRLILPIILVSICISMIMWIGVNYLIPHSTTKKNIFIAKYIKPSIKQSNNSMVHFFMSPSEKVFFRYYHEEDSTIRDFSILHFNKSGKLDATFVAKSLKSRGENRWTIDGWKSHQFVGDKEIFEWKEFEKKDTIFPFTPDEFSGYKDEMSMLSTSKLNDQIALNNKRGLGGNNAFLLQVYKRTAEPISVIILTLIGISVASRNSRGGTGLHLMFGVLVGALYILLSKFSETFVTNVHLPVIMGVWLPNVIFSIVAIILVNKAQK